MISILINIVDKLIFIVEFAIFFSFIITLIFILLGVPPIEIEKFWLNVLRIIFRYKEDSHEKRD